MRNTFRQGLISYQKDRTGATQFLSASTVNRFVALNVASTPLLATFAHGQADYLQAFDVAVPAAWGPITAGTNNYLYWDIDLLNGTLSFGITLPEPIVSKIRPEFPMVDQHWFDLDTNKMKVWSPTAHKWLEKVRVFAGKVLNGNSNQIIASSIGTQVELDSTCNPGFIMLDSKQRPIKTSTGEFLTTDTKIHVKSTSGSAGILATPINAFIPIRAGENIPAMSVVYFSGEDTASLASSDPMLVNLKTPIGLIQDSLATNEIGILTQTGTVTFDQWDWSNQIGKPVYCNSIGQLTTRRPNGLLVYRIGFIKNKNTILLNIDAETSPQVYNSAPNEVVIGGVTPLEIEDSVNAIGERIISISISPATGLSGGSMSTQQVLDLLLLTTQQPIIEANIASLRLDKANVVHSHSANDFLDLAPLLAQKLDVTANFDDRYSPLSHLHPEYSGVSHFHIIPQITGLQDELNTRAYRVHANSFTEIFEGVDRTGLADVGTGESLAAVLKKKTDIGHAHSVADVDMLQLELDNRAYLNHTHSMSQVTGLSGVLAEKAPLLHQHSAASIVDLTEVIKASGLINIRNVDADYTLSIEDAVNTLIRCRSTSPIQIVLPAHASTSIPIGASVKVRMSGLGSVTIVGEVGVTINTPSTLTLAGKNSTVFITKVDVDEWDIDGELTLTS